MKDKNVDISTYRNVVMQRDEAVKALGDLCHVIRNGVLNGMLPRKSDRAHADDPKAKCKNGFSREDVMWCMAKCCKGCEGIGNCHLSFEEKDLFDTMNKAAEKVSRKPAEIPDVTPESFDKYLPGSLYNFDCVWIARQLYRFCVGYWCYSDHSDVKSEKAWEKAFDDTLCIALDSIGKNGFSFRKFLEFAEKGCVDDGSKKFVEDHPEIEEIVKDAVDSRGVEIKADADDGCEALVLHAVLLRMDYQFAHDYPGADMGVYGDVFSSIIDGCLKIAYLYPHDRPKSYDFEDEDEYDRRLMEYEALRREKLIEFMEG